ncbi:putative polysaccharide biosynthesis protein [Metabacillus fastidiosus]|uniref:putative polysaccharide biosynthesis protein n=1 Tax=Metabacillus fastidiosus TaxID=1458 RepID=UPI003D276743
MSNKFLRGTFVLTLGTYISRILGMIYIIPFTALVGLNGNLLYQTGYAQYTIFLSIATAGFPAAVSKYVSKYNALGDYETSRRMFKAGLRVMLLTGVLAFLVLFFLAPYFAKGALSSDQLNGITVEDVTFVIRMVSTALLVVPIMSLIRGFFQGHQSMGPTAISQVIEQLVRIAFLLGATYYILKIMDGGNLVLAVGYATFAATVGAIGGLIVLIVYWLRRKNSLLAMKENEIPAHEVSIKSIFKEVLRYAAPFVFIGLAIPIYQLIDTYTFIGSMRAAGYEEIITDHYAITVSMLPKLIMIPVSLATAFGLTLIPSVTEAFTTKNYEGLRRQIDQTLQIIMFLVLPAVIGLSVLAGPAYSVFFGVKSLELGKDILMWYAPVALLFSLFTVNAAILQGMNKQKLAVISLVLGILVKLALNMPLIQMFQSVGSIAATALGYLVSLIYGFAMIKRHANYSYGVLIKRTFLIIAFGIFMGLTVSVTQSILDIFITYSDGRMQSVTVLAISVIVGVAVYLYVAYRSHLLEKLFGSRILKFIPGRRREY